MNLNRRRKRCLDNEKSGNLILHLTSVVLRESSRLGHLSSTPDHSALSVYLLASIPSCFCLDFIWRPAVMISSAYGFIFVSLLIPLILPTMNYSLRYYSWNQLSVCPRTQLPVLPPAEPYLLFIPIINLPGLLGKWRVFFEGVSE